jgi:hypothetical protein
LIGKPEGKAHIGIRGSAKENMINNLQQKRCQAVRYGCLTMWPKGRIENYWLSKTDLRLTAKKDKVTKRELREIMFECSML